MGSVATYAWISFTTDYGEADGYPAACRGVLARQAPHARILDVTHQVPARDVVRGARVLAQTVPYLPPAVHLAVVDPGVGTARRGICLVTASPDGTGGLLVGPDNGLLVAAAEALGGIRAAYLLAEARFWLPTVSRTFHGRDVFAPVAARLAGGEPPTALGPPVEPDTLVRLPPPVVVVDAGRISADVVTVDGFGNVQLAATGTDVAGSGLRVGQPVRVSVGGAARPALLGLTFDDVGVEELVVLIDSAGHLAVAVNGGSAAEALLVRPGAVVEVAAG